MTSGPRAVNGSPGAPAIDKGGSRREREGIREPQRHGPIPRPTGAGASMARGLALFRLTVRDILLDRKTLVVVGLLVLMLALPGFWLRDPPSSEDHAAMMFYLMIEVILYLQFIVLYTCLLFSSSLVTSEVEDRTMVYLISRPISRLEVLVYKYAGYVVAVWSIFALAAFVNYALLSPADADGFGGNLDILAAVMIAILIGVMAWGAVFLLLASVFRNPLAPGFLYCIFWESLFPNMGGNISMATITYQLRTYVIRGISRIDEISGGDLPVHGTYSAAWAFAGSAIASAVALFLAGLALRRRDFP